MSLDLALTRPLAITPPVTATKDRCSIFPGPMRASGSYKAIFDTSADLNLYRQAIQEPAVWQLSQPVSQGGATITVTLSLSGWTQGTVSLEEQYVSASYNLAGIANVTDSPETGVASIALSNFVNAAYGP